MREEIIRTLNDPELISIREYHMDRLEKIYQGEKLERPFVLSGYVPFLKTDALTDPEKWVSESLTDLYEHIELAADRDVFRPFCPYFWLYGVHFTDKVFGADVRPCGGDLWWSYGVPNQIGELPVPDLEKNETWKQAQRLTLAQLAAGVRLPFYSTQVLGEPWNQLFNIYGEEGLYGFYDHPEGMKRDLKVITDTIIEMHKWFRGVIPAEQFQPIVAQERCQPRGYGQMCGCSTHMISGEIYDEFLREADTRVLSVYEKGGMLHLCGNHVQHVPAWKEMSCVKALQLNDRAMEDLPYYFREMRKDQILYLVTYPGMTASKALELTNGGERSVICTWDDEMRQQRFIPYEEAIGG